MWPGSRVAERAELIALNDAKKGDLGRRVSMFQPHH